MHKLISFSSTRRLPPSPPSFPWGQREMESSRRFRGAFCYQNNQRTAEGDAIPNEHPAEFRTQPTYERGVHGQELDQPTTNHPPEYSSAWTGSSFGIHSSGVRETSYGSHPVSGSIPQSPSHTDVSSQGFTLPRSPLPVTHPSSHGLVTDAHDQGCMLGGWQELRNNVTRVPRNAFGPGEGISRAIMPLERESEYPVRNPTTSVPACQLMFPVQLHAPEPQAPRTTSFGEPTAWLYATSHLEWIHRCTPSFPLTVDRSSQAVYSHAARLPTSTTLPRFPAANDIGTNPQ